jgi:hypothetical protein
MVITSEKLQMTTHINPNPPNGKPAPRPMAVSAAQRNIP